MQPDVECKGLGEKTAISVWSTRAPHISLGQCRRILSVGLDALPSPNCLTVSPAVVSMEPTSDDVTEIRPSRSLPPGVLARYHSLEQVFLQPTGTEYAPTTPKGNRKPFAD